MDYYFIGDAELVTAFRFVGVEGQAVYNADDARLLFRKITQSYDETAGTVLPGAESCRVLILTEEVVDWLDTDVTQWQMSGKYPLIVEIPGTMGKLEGRETLVDSIREAIGIHI